MAKYGPRYLKPDDLFDFKTHWAVGLEYPIEGSKGNKYTVEITPKGFTCDCTGMTYHGKCKHTRNIAQLWRDVISDDFEEKFLTSAK